MRIPRTEPFVMVLSHWNLSNGRWINWIWKSFRFCLQRNLFYFQIHLAVYLEERCFLCNFCLVIEFFLIFVQLFRYKGTSFPFIMFLRRSKTWKELAFPNKYCFFIPFNFQHYLTFCLHPSDHSKHSKNNCHLMFLLRETVADRVIFSSH